MSSKLYWRPTAGGQRLGYALKWAISERLWQHDGSLRSDWTVVGRGFLPFLEGVCAGKKEDDEVRVEAERLIELIEQHGEVEVCLDD